MFNVHVNILKQRQRYEHNIGQYLQYLRTTTKFLFVSYTTQIYAPKSLSAVSVVMVFTILGIGARQEIKSYIIGLTVVLGKKKTDKTDKMVCRCCCVVDAMHRRLLIKFTAFIIVSHY